MSNTKKNVKKSTQSTVLPFNKKNATTFGQAIFNEGKDGIVSFTRLCNGSLEDKDNKRTVHCAIGEAYSRFVNHSFSKVCSIVENAEADDLNGKGYDSKYGTLSSYCDGATL